jgi:acyl transferase domain-containing protein/acyl carrier protein
MIKAALALHHQVLPPTINVTQPNPRLKMESSAFYLNTEARPWIRSDAPRRAGVSSFGFGGTNYHIVLEEYEPAHKNGYRLHRTPQPILLQAATPNQLVQVCEQCLQQLHSEEGDRSFAILVETSKSMEIPIDAARLGFVAISGAEASQKLASAIACLKGQLDGDSWEHPTGIFYRRQGLDLTGKVVALFSGQGSQYLNMGRELVMNFPELQQTFAEVDELFMQADLEPPSQRVFPTPAFSKDQTQAQAQELQRTEFAQPALGAFSVGLYKLLHKAGFRPDFLAGHSFGELTALWAAKVLTDADYFSLVKARSQAMAKPTEADAGTMMAVKGEVHAVETIVKSFPGVAIANRNSPQQLVLAGTRADLEPVQIALKKQKFSTVWLPVSAAFHTSLVDYAQQPFAAAVETAQLQTPQVPIYTNVTARPYPDDVEAMRSNLKAHMSQPVLFTEQIEHLYNAGGYCFVEFGPRRVLTNLVQETLGDRPHLAIALNASRQKDSDRQLREALIQLRVAGLPLKDLDPYQRLLEAPRSSRTEKKLNVRLNGNNYVSTKTQQSIAALETVASSRVLAFDPSISVLQPELAVITNDRPVPLAATTAAQANGHLELSGGHNNNGRQLNGDRRSQANGPPSDPMKSNSHRSDPTRATASCSQGSVAGRTQPSASNRSAARLDGSADRILDSMEHLLSHFNQHHSETLQTHQQYLNNHLAYTQGFLQLMHRQNDLLLDGDIPADQTSITSEVMGSLERNLMQFHRHQAETLKTHDQSISAHGEYAKHFFQLIQQQYGQLITPVTPEPMHPPQPEVANRSPNPLIDALIPQSELSLPSDWVEPNGLSVDSERPLNFTNGTLVSSSLNPSIADLTVPLNGMNSVAESAISNGNLAIAQSEANATHFMDQDPVETIAGPTEVAAAIEVVHLSQALLAVVSDKTGYPIEMLELNMDMEADLGIDSIKRFEILGALMEQYPEFPQPDLEALAEVEMRTLNQVVVLMQSLSPAQASSSSLSISSDTDSSLAVSQDLERVTNGPDLAPPLIREELEVGAPDIVSNAAATAIAESVLPVNSSAIDRETLRQALLLVVSDKTGYPVEMLEPNMDMEADLGIDSIKRFEILGALMEQYPEFPQPDLEALAEVEMRTLDQVIDFMQGQFTEKKKNSLTVEEHKSEQPSTNISRRPVHLEFLPPPDKMDFTLADQHITVLTDYGSPITAQVAQSLLDLGWRVVILKGPHAVDSPLPKGVDLVVLQDASEAHLEQQLGAIATQYGSIGAFIHLHPTFATTPTCLFLEEDAAIVKQVFLIAKHLKIALNQAASLGRSCFLTVAYLDGELGLSGKANFSPISAGLFGLTKSLNWEWDSVFCRAIDLSPDLDMATSLGYVLAELQDPNRLITEVGYGPNGRTTLVC